MRFGMHMTQKGGFVKNVQRAAALGCQTLQVFIGSPTSWNAPRLEPAEIDRRRRVLQECAIEPLVIHTAYLVNLATQKKKNFMKNLACCCSRPCAMPTFWGPLMLCCMWAVMSAVVSRKGWIFLFPRCKKW